MYIFIERDVLRNLFEILIEQKKNTKKNRRETIKKRTNNLNIYERLLFVCYRFSNVMALSFIIIISEVMRKAICSKSP